MMNTDHFSTLSERDWSIWVKVSSLASKSCNEFVDVKFPSVLKLFQHPVNASSNMATVTFFTVFKVCRCRPSWEHDN